MEHMIILKTYCYFANLLLHCTVKIAFLNLVITKKQIMESVVVVVAR